MPPTERDALIASMNYLIGKGVETVGDFKLAKLVNALEKCGDPEVIKCRKKKAPSEYNLFVGECRRGDGRFEGQGKGDFKDCVAYWHEYKAQGKVGETKQAPKQEAQNGGTQIPL